MYRELAGGLTISNLLHGSANTIGGQNAVIKLRWGQPAQDLFVDGATPGIKCALGENVKQSNWGDDFKSRYPQTRMGVEQFLRDRYQAAHEYQKEWAEWRKRKKGAPPRRELQLDALAEILDGERLVHCHSYRSDEIIMYLRVAEDFGFRIGTFQHVLEGYKCANEMAAHGAGASCFSDWWAYKYEVIDAIPYAGKIMWERGVLTSFNSDSSELSRRLNLEAAKAVKYGGVPDEEALAFVTSNPARQLGIAGRVGSLEPGKDGDFVLWTAHPLSDQAVVDETWIDGVMRFSRERDHAARGAADALRERLLEKADAHRRAHKIDKAGGSRQPTFGALWEREDAGWELRRGDCVLELGTDCCAEVGS
jgi:N-acetylglucosamine-6-phosphate deacetylase